MEFNAIFLLLYFHKQTSPGLKRSFEQQQKTAALFSFKMLSFFNSRLFMNNRLITK